MGSELGGELRRHRKMHGDLGISEMAARAGVSERALSNYELGKRSPDIDFLARFAAITGADIGTLIRLRLQDSGHDPTALRLEDSRGEYLVGQATAVDCAAHARRAVLEAGDLDPAWSLGIMELATRGEISPAGIDRLIEFIREREADEKAD